MLPNCIQLDKICEFFHKFRLAPLIFSGVISAGVFLSAGGAWGEDIEFTNPSQLAHPRTVLGTVNAPDQINSLFPGTGPSDNTVTVSSGSIGGNVYGGIAADSGTNAVGNTVTVTGGTIGSGGITGSVTGGWSFNGNVENNHVDISGDGTRVRYIIFGGYIEGGNSNATGNSVFIGSGATVNNNIYGGYSQAGSSQITGNSIVFDGGYATNNNAIIAGAYSALASNTISGNSVTIQSGTINNARIYGGRAQANSVASGNSVSVTGGTILAGSIYGGQNMNGSGAVTGNDVSISGGTVTVSAIYGGQSGRGSAVTGNTVTLDGGIISGDVYGGYSNRGSATDNTVTIRDIDVANSSLKQLYGGYVNSGAGDKFSGNTLNLHTAGLTADGLQNFEFLNFYIPDTLPAGGTMLNVTGTADITDSTVYVEITGDNSPLQPGEHFVLINAAGGIQGEPLNDKVDGTGMLGVSVQYQFDISVVDGHELWASIANTTLNPQTKSFSEGYLAGLAKLNQGGDLVAGHIMGEAVRAACNNPDSCGIFADMIGGKSRYSTGSHFNLSSFSLITGVSKYMDTSWGRLTAAAFFEYGSGSYDTFNSFAGVNSVYGDGDLSHLGGGFLARMDFGCLCQDHFYAEASFRAGRLHNEFGAADLLGSSGGITNYDFRSAYTSFHVGGGKIFYFSENTTFDLYIKYFGTQLNGKNVRLSSGESIVFDDLKSSRLRIGGRFAFNKECPFTPYIGLAWEHEFSGSADGSIYGFAIDAPTLRGNTGIGEIGFAWKSQTSGFFADCGLQGYVGKREGWTTSLLVGWNF